MPELTSFLNEHLFTVAILGGYLPTLIWLWFFLKVDRANPEPKRVIIGSFVFGSLAALFAIPFQGFVVKTVFFAPVIVIILLSSVEEIVKYYSVRWSAIKDVENNEPLDPLIYIITAALGFAAMENTLYLINYLNNFDLFTSALERGKRFFGATLLHTTSSAFVGLARALSYYKPGIKGIATIVGLLLAIAFHSGFNYLVTSDPPEILLAFSSVWLTLFIVIVISQIIKRTVKK